MADAPVVALDRQELAADLQAREGAAFTLKSFHDRLMQVGQPPLRIVRRELLGGDSPSL